MAPHTTAHWPESLYLPSAIVERDNRENWTKAGAPDTYARAVAETDRRLAAYRQLETDPVIEAELARIIRSGLTEQTELPLVPPAPEPVAVDPEAGGRRRNRRREGRPAE
jgi:trimethylamine:corrinoid methyltransferase-like protein